MSTTDPMTTPGTPPVGLTAVAVERLAEAWAATFGEGTAPTLAEQAAPTVAALVAEAAELAALRQRIRIEAIPARTYHGSPEYNDGWNDCRARAARALLPHHREATS